MSIYLRDDLVLTDGGSVAIDISCCCCPTITLSCESILASKAKCGFQQFDSLSCYNPSFSGPIAIYLSETDSYHSEFGGFLCDGTTVWSCDQFTCVITNDGGGLSGSGCGVPGSPVGTTTCTCGLACGPCVPPLLGCGTCAANCTFSVSGTSASFDSHPPGGTQTNTTASLSSEYTTAMLISNTEAALPPYDDVFDGPPCASIRDLSEDQISYTIQRFKPKFSIAIPLGSDLVICYNEHFVPEGGGDPVDTPKTATISAGNTEIIGDEVLEPAENGQTEITDITCC